MNINDVDYKIVLWKSLALDPYFWFQDEASRLAEDDEERKEEYIKKFVGFYKLRRNSDTWIKPFFKIFAEAYKEKDKLTKKSFEKYLKEVEDKCVHNGKKQKEISFVSKMLHTLRPDIFPIYDSKVVSSLGLKFKPEDNWYSMLIDKYDSLLNDNDRVKQAMKGLRKLIFEININNREITDYKLLDMLFYA